MRIAVCTRVQIIAEDNGRVSRLEGHILDVSAGGCAVRVHAHLERGLALRLQLEVGGVALRVPGRVMWSKIREGAYIVGVCFENLGHEQEAALRTYVAQQQRRRITI